jgi:hypothetical protein
MRVAVADDTAILAAVYHRQKEIVDLLFNRGFDASGEALTAHVAFR